jgi:hypothetical protein
MKELNDESGGPIDDANMASGCGGFGDPDNSGSGILDLSLHEYADPALLDELASNNPDRVILGPKDDNEPRIPNDDGDIGEADDPPTPWVLFVLLLVVCGILGAIGGIIYLIFNVLQKY